METTIIIAVNVVMSIVVAGVLTMLAPAARFKTPDGEEGRADWRGPLCLDLPSA